ncbi:integral membrane protein [Streptomyces zinciresistens K42]|uniref:Integral membrane protein n=1 Tax=Streptomyces zinciresistens K42 TaxID=700597 RepID=G2GDJ4_9ACTN|nr:class E sortase [Streptomyces zinciresistens]EGX58415.1 integral membrane protein [Streptomyces zinciresistens K42]
MTALRPERESGSGYGESPAGSHGETGDQSAPYGYEPYAGSAALGDWYGDGHTPHGQAAQAQPAQPYGADGYGSERYGAETYGGQGYGGPHGSQGQGSRGQGGRAPGAPAEPVRRRRAPAPREPYTERSMQPPDEETVALRIAGPGAAGGPLAPSPGSAASPAAGTPTGGRAARRKAAKGRRGRPGGSPRDGAGTDPESSGAPLSRMEARRQARARRPGPAVLASRAIGEVFITTGVVMLLFVSYQLWWTNFEADAQAQRAASSLQDEWADGKRNPGVFEAGQGFALLTIPKLDVVVPIAEGISKEKVLDRGMVGHYSEGRLKTAMPDAKTGNFAVAGHRNTHGEPFRYINRLTPGDDIVVETQDTYYVYKMASILPVTSPSNVSVLEPIPKGSGFTKAGRYITLTTCTPEFTSKYRLIVWGKMVEERPRSKGKPDALVN